MRDKILVVGHMRSGHHFLGDSIGLNSSYNDFVWLGIPNDLNKTKPGIIYKNHGFAKWHENCMKRLLDEFHIFIPVRDGRDVLVSTFHFLKVHTRHKIREDMSFQEFLRHGDSCYIHHWVEHVAGWLKYPVCYVRYEDMSFNFKRTINQVLEVIEDPIKKRPIKPKFGIYYSKNNIQRKGIVGDWKNYFTEKDLELFNDIAGKTMEKFGYYEGRCW